MTKLGGFLAALVVGSSQVASADEVPPPTAPAPRAFWPPGFQAAEPKPPYTQAFQLRGVTPKNAVRLDTVVALYRVAAAPARVTIAFLSAQWRVTELLALQLRWGIDSNQTDFDSTSRTGIVNPTANALIGIPISRKFRFAVSFSLGVPLATGGGDHPSPEDVALHRAALLARSAMDNVAFSINSVGFPTGISLAYLSSGFTAQLDMTVIPTVRVKGAQAEPDSYKINSTYGFFVGYLFLRELSIGAEIRYQSYLSTPASVTRDSSARDNLTLAGGPRFHLELGRSVWMRPAITYGQGILGAVEQQSFHMVQLDLPVSF